MANETQVRKNIFGRRAEEAKQAEALSQQEGQSTQEVHQEHIPSGNDLPNDMPVWDEPPMDAYLDDNSRPLDNDNYPEQEMLHDDFNASQADTQGNNESVENVFESEISVINGNPEIYSYPRSVQKFNQNILFQAGISLEVAKKAQQAELDKKNSTNNYKAQAPVAPKPAPVQAPAQQPASQTPVAPKPAPVQTSAQQPAPVEDPVSIGDNSQEEDPAPANSGNGNTRSTSNHFAYLDATPLLIIMEHFANKQFYDAKTGLVQHQYENNFDMCGYKIVINTEKNKWYNTVTRKGNTNALSLARELIAIDEDINLDSSDGFKLAGSKAAKIVNQIQRNIEKYTDLNELISYTLPRDKTQNSKNAPATDEPPKKTAEEEKEAWKQMREYLNNIPLREIAEWLGATPGEDGNPELWKFHSTSHNISITGQRFKNWNYSGGSGGYGAINFMKQHIAITEMISESEDDILYKKAFNALMKEFGDKDFKYTLSADKLSSSFCFPHILPGKTDEIKYYLKDQRNIPLWMINKQISNGVLFAGYPSDREPHKLLRESEKMNNNNVWATFLSPNGMAAEMRGIGDNKPLKGLAAGSEKNSGGYMVLAEPKYDENILSICEASVDATSYSSLYPGRTSTSVMGVTVDLAVELAFEADSRDMNTHLNFDNDFAGNSATYQFHKKMLEQVEDEESYNEYLKDGKIKYFDLGIQVFKESLKVGTPYYFETNSNEDGMATANLFLQALFREMPRDEVKNHLIKGRLRVNNICPAWTDVKDPDFEAKKAIELLQKNPRYYFYPEPVKALEPMKRGMTLTPEQEALREENHARNIKTREDFIEAFHKNAGEENIALWTIDKRITSNTDSLSKDWNEWLGYQLKNHKHVKELFEQREEEFKHYADLVKKMPPTELGNNEKIKRLKP